MSFQDLAAVLGSRRESVAAILRAFHRQGLIHLGMAGSGFWIAQNWQHWAISLQATLTPSSRGDA